MSNSNRNRLELHCSVIFKNNQGSLHNWELYKIMTSGEQRYKLPEVESSYMIRFQDSPVAEVMRVRKELPKELKFWLWVVQTLPKRFIPRIEQMKISNINRQPILASQGMVIISIVKMLFNYFVCLINLSMRATLNTFITDITVPESMNQFTKK